MDRLTGLDASFLYLETPAQLMHVCGLMVLDPASRADGYDFGRMRAEVAARVRNVPTFTRKVRRAPLGLDHPTWVPDHDFDIDRHVHRRALPRPGGYAELMEICEDLAGEALDRRRPLWEMWFIEGYGDKLVVLVKMHHATVDGVSGSNLISYLCSLEPDADPLLTAEEREPVREPGAVELLGRALVHTAARPLTVARAVGASVPVLGDTVRRAITGSAMSSPFTAPRTSFNGTITGHRTLALADLDLAEIRRLKDATGSSVNDVVLSVCGGVLRSYLEERGELPRASLLGMVPVSVRESSSRARGANKVSGMFAKLFTDVADPLERLRRMQESNRVAKEHNQAIGADALQDWAEFAAPRTFGLAARTYAALKLAEKHPVVYNLVISNVPGPPMPLYFMGALVEGMYALGPIFYGTGLNITVLSQNGRMHVGMIGCRELMPGLQGLADRFEDEIAALAAAVDTTQDAAEARELDEA